MKKIGIYTYGGSGNHGCEALLRTARQLMPCGEMTVFTERPKDDEKYLGDLDAMFVDAKKVPSLLTRVLNKLGGRNTWFKRYYAPTIQGAAAMDLMVSIGGDNYCYDDYMRVPGMLREEFGAEKKTVLLGCSIDEKVMQYPEVVKDLEAYKLITAREPLTYEILKKHLKQARVEYYPDSAFILPVASEVKMPAEGDFVGLNLSPMVLNAQGANGCLMDSAYELIDYILQNTTFHIALIPHVVWENNDDRVVLEKVYQKYIETGRVFLIEDADCCHLKGYISQCRFFVGARTHSTIAAYSTCVPTIVLGYSIKSRGIALDLFGTTENYVLPVQELKQGELRDAFVWMQEKEEEIRQHLNDIMPAYKEKAAAVGKELKEILG